MTEFCLAGHTLYNTYVHLQSQNPMKFSKNSEILLVAPMSFYCHRIFIGQINEYPMKITHKNSMKNNFMEYFIGKVSMDFHRFSM